MMYLQYEWVDYIMTKQESCKGVVLTARIVDAHYNIFVLI